MNSQIKILLVDDDDIFRQGCKRLLEREGYNIFEARTGLEGLRIAEERLPDIAFIDFRMPGMDGVELLEKLKALSFNIDVVMVTGYATVETAVSAIQNGAYDYISKPFDPIKLIQIAQNIIKKRNITTPKSGSLNLVFESKELSIIGKSVEMQRVFDLVGKVAATDSTVLILGESGTGKELIAKAIHANSKRKKKEYFAIDCGSLVETLLESELFGHVKGSFTGASATKHGAFELANSGTFFMDEIGNISLNVQAKILRAIQEKQIRRVGGNSTIDIDVRLITATNIDLRKAVEDGRFREDLYYRISVVPVHLPPLRKRKEDIPDLVSAFIEKYNQKQSHILIEGISNEALAALVEYDWPGNVRELENTIERAIVISDRDFLTLDSFPEQFKGRPISGDRDLLSLADVEKFHIKNVLEKTGRNISKSAKILKIDRKTLYDKIKKYSLN